MSAFPRRLSSRLLKIGTPVGLSAGLTLGALHFRGRNCSPDQSFSPRQDPVFKHPLMTTINPSGNPTFHDSWERSVSFDQIRPDLLEDALKDGTSLLEHFAKGVWGSRGKATTTSLVIMRSPHLPAFGFQRNIMKVARKSTTNKQDLWEREELRWSKFPEGEVPRFAILKTQQVLIDA